MMAAVTLASGGAMLASVARAQKPAAPNPSKPYVVAPEHALPYKPILVKGTDGTVIAAQEWGNSEGPEIVLIHGVLQSHLSFERQVMSDLARSFRMITYDLRGHGDSEKPIRQEQYQNGELWADDLAAVIEGAGLRRPVLVGWSLGGLPIANYLQKYGDAKLAGLNFVDAVIKLSPDYAGYPENRPLLARTASPDLATRIDAMRGFLRSCFTTQPAPADFERMLAFNAQVPQYVVPAILAHVPLNADEALSKVKVPVLLTHGAEDGQISVKITAFGHSVMPHAKLSIYEGSGHSPFYEMAPRFNDELAGFVRAANA